MKNISILLLGLLFAGFYFSCAKIDDFKKYTDGGPIRYVGGIDSVIVRPGFKRIMLSMIPSTDPSIEKVKVYWNDRNDSSEAILDKDIIRKGDTLDLIIEGLEERAYSFEIYTFDGAGHSSLVKNAFGEVFGDEYQALLSNRLLKQLAQTPEGGTVILEWSSPQNDEIATEIRYSTKDGEERELFLLPEMDSTILTDYKENDKLYYRTLFAPDSLFFDTLWAEFIEIDLPSFERELNKDKFKEFHLPTDIDDGGYGWNIEFLWDENYGTPGWATAVGMPQSYTLDLGETTKLSRFKTWQAPDRLYEKQSIKRFEIWGSEDPDPDGSWDSWIKLLTCESEKPSGLPLGSVSEEDVEYAESGEEFTFPETIREVRYIRIKVLETWGNDNWSTMSELSFWTRDH